MSTRVQDMLCWAALFLNTTGIGTLIAFAAKGTL
jgi:hypothetical protein